MSAYRIYSLWASMKGEDEPAPWLIAAEDEASWEGDAERCEAVFKAARVIAERNDWEVREITLAVNFAALDRAFAPAEVDAQVQS